MENQLDINRAFAGLGGLFGAAGIAAYAAAAHSASGHMATIAPILFIHAPAFLVLSPLAKLSRAAYSAVSYEYWDCCSSSAISHRAILRATGYLPSRALGGTLLILGWLVVATTAFRILDYRK